MSPVPLETLKRGLSALRDKVQTRKTALQAQLSKREKIPEEDEVWLENDANAIDEELVIEALENASDYERGLARLDDKQKGLVARLKEFGKQAVAAAAPPGNKIAGNKRKRPEDKVADAGKSVAEGKHPGKKKAAPSLEFTHREIATVASESGKSSALFDTTDEGIRDALVARATEEVSRLKGGDNIEDSGESDEYKQAPRPSRRDALQAVAIIQRYIVGINDEFSRELESVLAQFGRETRREANRTMLNGNIVDA